MATTQYVRQVSLSSDSLMKVMLSLGLKTTSTVEHKMTEFRSGHPGCESVKQTQNQADPVL